MIISSMCFVRQNVHWNMKRLVCEVKKRKGTKLILENEFGRYEVYKNGEDFNLHDHVELFRALLILATYEIDTVKKVKLIQDD